MTKANDYDYDCLLNMKLKKLLLQAKVRWLIVALLQRGKYPTLLYHKVRVD
jgi:hypothetical protein